jgi:hypothetical protein
MTLADLKAYFEHYATLHVDLLHNPASVDTTTFFCMNIEKNTDEFIRDNPLDLIMILLVPDKSLKQSGDNYSYDKHVAYLVLQRCPDKTNDAIITAQNFCELIADDFVTRLINDRHVLIDGFDTGSVKTEPIGPMGDNHYGFITMFTLIDLFDEQVDPNRWTA